MVGLFFSLLCYWLTDSQQSLKTQSISPPPWGSVIWCASAQRQTGIAIATTDISKIGVATLVP